MDELNEMLTETVKSQIEDLKALQAGSEEHSNQVEDINKLYQLLNDQEERNNKRFDRWMEAAVDFAGVVLPLGFYGIWMKRGFKFEETGAFSSTTFKNLIRFFKPN